MYGWVQVQGILKNNSKILKILKKNSKCVSGNFKDTNFVGLYDFYLHLCFSSFMPLISKTTRKCKKNVAVRKV